MNVAYVYDPVLNKFVYGSVDESINIEEAIKVAEAFKKLDKNTQEYLAVRLDMLVEKNHDNNL